MSDHTELATQHSTDLVIAPDQTRFNAAQRAALEHMGVANAPDGDLNVFFHRSKTTGLDPFSGQIHMIGRKTWNPETGTKETRYTIQTGIDGYRLIARRAADAAGHILSMSEPVWMHPDGTWREAWSRTWGYPMAARVIVYRDGQPFPGVAMFDEYVQTFKDKQDKVRPTSMWEQRPAGQLAKCAEALALRRAYPNDLASIYTDDEMGQADGDGAVRDAPHRPTRRRVTASAFTAQVVPGTVVDDNDSGSELPTTGGEETISDEQSSALHAKFADAGITDNKRKGAYLSGVLDRQVSRSEPLTVAEYDTVMESLASDIADTDNHDDADEEGQR